jgi:hypothetical protein
MSEVFRQRQTTVESPVEPETAPQGPQPTESSELAGNETKATDEITVDEKTLEIWEGLNRRKYATEYFDIGNIDGEFNLKMETAVIDKFIKGELETKKYEKNIDNWKEVLQEIENEIGSNRLELFTRIKKIVSYIRVLNKYRESKRRKEQFLNSNNDE